MCDEHWNVINMCCIIKRTTYCESVKPMIMSSISLSKYIYILFLLRTGSRLSWHCFHAKTGEGFLHHRESFAHCPWKGNAPLSTQSITGHPDPNKHVHVVLNGSLRRPPHFCRIHSGGWRDWWFPNGIIYPTISGSRNKNKNYNPSWRNIDHFCIWCRKM